MSGLRFLFLKLNVWLCLASALMVAITAMALSIPLEAVGLGLLLPPLLFYFIYVEERRSVSPEDELNHPRRTALVRRHRTALLATELVALVGYEALLAILVLSRPAGGVVPFALGQLPLVVLAAYGRLKRRPMFDSLAVGATWAFVVVFSSVVAASPGAIRDLGGVFLAWFLVAFAGVESRNVPDAEGDTRADRTTLAGALGRRPATALIILLKSAGVAVFWVVSGTVVAASALGYLALLRLFRTLTRLETVRSEDPDPEGGLDESGVSTE